MKASFVLMKSLHADSQGGVLLQNIFDSSVGIVEIANMRETSGEAMSAKMEGLADDLRAKGEKPFVVRHSMPDISAILGRVGWVNAADGLTTQLKDLNIETQYVALANGGGGPRRVLRRWLRDPHQGVHRRNRAPGPDGGWIPRPGTEARGWPGWSTR